MIFYYHLKERILNRQRLRPSLMNEVYLKRVCRLRTVKEQSFIESRNKVLVSSFLGTFKFHGRKSGHKLFSALPQCDVTSF